jgi:pilus assembly protein CpaF
MVLMAGFDLPIRAIRDQMASTIQLVLQLERQPNGRRAVKSLTEVYGIEDDTILLQDLFLFDPAANELRATGMRPTFQEVLDHQALADDPVPAPPAAPAPPATHRPDGTDR